MTFSALKFALSADESAPVDLTHTIFVMGISPVSGKRIEFYEFIFRPSSVSMTVDWGDGTVVSYTPTTWSDGGRVKYGVSRVSHVYADYGEYKVRISDDVSELTVVDPEPFPPVVPPSVWDGLGIADALCYVVCLAPHLDSIGGYGLAGLTFLQDGRVRHAGTGVAIGPYGFSGCHTMRSFEQFARAISSSGEGAFSRCSSLRTLAGMSAFNPVSARSFYACSALESIVGGFSPSVVEFGESIFEGCTSLSSLEGLPSGLETLGSRAFAGCSALSSLSPLSGTAIASLGAGCFEDCASLRSMDGLPSTVSYLPDRCFAGCPFIGRYGGTDSWVEVPTSIVDVGRDCFTFDGYMQDGRPLLAAVYFPLRSAQTIRSMTGFPFGIPPGCSIYSGYRALANLVYTEPLPSS